MNEEQFFRARFAELQRRLEWTKQYLDGNSKNVSQEIIDGLGAEVDSIIDEAETIMHRLQGMGVF